MGQKALAYFEEADRIGGVLGKVRLAALTTVTSAQALGSTDTPELLGRFETAMAQVRSEMQTHKSSGSRELPSARVAVGGAAQKDLEALRRHVAVYADLMSQRALVLGDIDGTVRRVNEAATEAIDVARVSVWFLDEARTKIRCQDLYERKDRAHVAGTELFEKDFPSYFAALSSEQTIAAHDAHHDPRTSCFSEVYLKPLGINSMLDVPIWTGGKMVGVVCHEHTGPQRTWNADEERFAYLMSAFVAMALENHK